MIITITHPDAAEIKCYDKFGSVIKKLQEVDTHNMMGKQVVGVCVAASTMILKTVIIYKIKGPGIFFKRKPHNSRVINTKKRK